MRNVWKGLIIGALTGAAAGAVLDLGESGARGASALGEAMVQHAPEVADHLRHSVTDAVSAASARARNSELPAQAKAASVATQGRVSGAVSDGLQKAGEAAGQGREKVNHVIDRAKDSVGPS